MLLEGLDTLTFERNDDSNYAGKVLMATVNNDVHDTWKKIVAVVLGYINYSACCPIVLFKGTEQCRRQTVSLLFVMFSFLELYVAQTPILEGAKYLCSGKQSTTTCL